MTLNEDHSGRRQFLKAAAWAMPVVAVAVAAPAAVASEEALSVTNLTGVHDGNLVTITLTAAGLSASNRAIEIYFQYTNGIVDASPEVPILVNGVNQFGVADERTYWVVESMLLVFATSAGTRSFTIPVTYATP